MTRNLVRARGYRDVYDLSDGLPDPAPDTLTCQVWADTEDALASVLAEMQRRVRTATRLGRDSDTAPGVSRWEAALLGGSLLAVPGDVSTVATVTLTVIRAQVPDVDGISPYF